MIETKFKDSELGPIPEDWEVKSIGALSYLMNDGPFGSDLKQEHYTSKKEARIIQLSNIGDNGWNDSNVKYTTFDYAFKIKKHIVKPGQIIVAKMMPAGRAIVCPTHEKCFVQGSDAIKICFTNEIKPDYFVYFTKSQSYINFVEENTQGSTRQRISITKYRDFPCLIPPTIDEQERIAEALSDVDALIKELDALIEKKRMVLKATMQDLLTARRRLPGFSEPWKEVKLGDLVNIHSGDTITAQQFVTNGHYPVYGANGIRGKYNSFNLDGEFILIGRVGALCGNIHISKGKVWASEHTLVCYPHSINLFSPVFLAHILERMNLIQYSGASAQPVIASNKLKPLLIRMPNLSEQQAIAAILSDLDLEIAELEKKKEKYTSIRQGMMQQLLTGKIRLI